jgi:hypothetical protein
MKQTILLSALAAAMLFTLPSVAAVLMVAPGIEQMVDDDISIAVSGQSVLVTGAQGETLEVVSLTGRCIYAVKIETPAQKVELNIPKGCYILKVGKVVRKVSIR